MPTPEDFEARAIEICSALVRRGGLQLFTDDLLLLRSYTVPADLKQRAGKLGQAAKKGYYTCAAEGYAFVPVEFIERRFGRTLQENYPTANDVFIRFAVSYWTLKLMLRSDQTANAPQNCAVQLMHVIEEEVRTAFFPTPGPATKASLEAMRGDYQRAILREAEAPINIEEFIAGNPILAPPPQAGPRTGCAIAVVVVPLGALGSILRELLV